MALSPAQRERLRTAAEREGVDVNELIAMAEADDSGPRGESPKAAGGQPLADRLLIGFLPFMTVRELRQTWLKLSGPFPDDELPTPEWLIKHGGNIGGPAEEP